jgi:hypothetical protein
MKTDLESEIKLAERGFHVLMERVALRRMPADALPTGDVYDLLNAVGEKLEIEGYVEKGEKVSKRRTRKAAAKLKATLKRLAKWPEEPRIKVATMIADTLRRVELDAVVDDLLAAMLMLDAPEAEGPREPETAERGGESTEPDGPKEIEPSQEIEGSEAPDEVAELAAEQVPDRIREIIESSKWTPELGDLLRRLREMTLEDPDSGHDDLLTGGIVFNAVAGRKHLLLEERRRLAEAEPIPEELAEAVDGLPDTAIESELARLGLRLVLADVVSGEFADENNPPEITVAATLVAMQRADEPEKKPDINSLGDWAKTNPLKLDVISDDIAPVFEWKPKDHDGSVERRNEQRWKVQSLLYQFLPVRWMPSGHDDLPPYSDAAARERLEELRDHVWLMVDEIEPVRFVSEAFQYGDGAPDAVGLEVVRDIIALWQEQSLVSAVEDFGRAYLEDEWKHEIPEDEAGEPSELVPPPKTADGEPLVLCHVDFDVTEGAQSEIIGILDQTEGFRRQQVAAGDCWVWFGPSKGRDKAAAELTLDEEAFTVQTQSLSWASKANSRLVEELGERIVLRDIRTQEASPEMLAELGIDAGDDGSAEAGSEEQKKVVHQVLENHYRKWLYDPLPALDDAAPRDAVTDPVTRVEVIKLLLEAEDRTRSSSWPMNEFDFAFLWEELGVTRDEVD